MYQCIDVPLKCCRSIDQAERDDGILIVAIPRTKRSLPLVSRCDLESMIGLTDVKLRKIAGARQAVDCLADQQQWETIFLRNLVETTKIHA